VKSFNFRAWKYRPGTGERVERNFNYDELKSVSSCRELEHGTSHILLKDRGKSRTPVLRLSVVRELPQSHTEPIRVSNTASSTVP
jgi:hypothetical protein